MKNIFLSDDAEDCMLFSEVSDEILMKQEANLAIVNDGMALMQRPEGTSNNNDIIDKMYAFGANYYICMPPTYPLFKKVIETVLSFDWNLLLNQHPSRKSFMSKVA